MGLELAFTAVLFQHEGKCMCIVVDMWGLILEKQVDGKVPCFALLSFRFASFCLGSSYARP